MKYKGVLVVACVLVVVGVGVVLVYVDRTHADLAPAADDGTAVVYSSMSADGIGQQIWSGTVGGASQIKNAPTDGFNAHTKDLFLSPDRKYIAVTTAPVGEVGTRTYIADLSGTVITTARPGRFASWSPDSSKVLLYLSGALNPDGKRMYVLELNGKYYDSGLPQMTLDANISPLDGSIVYSVGVATSSDSTVYVRDPEGQDRILLRGNGATLGWLRYSPDGKYIAFMRYIISGGKEDQSVWIVKSDGTGSKQLSDVIWNYPPMWSPDGSHLLFVRQDGRNVWEYSLTSDSLAAITHLTATSVEHPSYSSDGKAIVFSADVAGVRQIWMTRDGVATQLSHGPQSADYPIVP